MSVLKKLLCKIEKVNSYTKIDKKKKKKIKQSDAIALSLLDMLPFTKLPDFKLILKPID